jgi:hypothetical protein
MEHKNGKSPAKNNLQRNDLEMTHCFRGFNPWLPGPIAFRPVMKQNITVEGCGRAKLFTSWCRKAERETGRG